MQKEKKKEKSTKLKKKFTLHKKWSFPLRVSSVNVTKTAFFMLCHAFFYKQRFCLTQTQCCLTFSWIEPQMLLRCCLIHISSIILRHFLYLLYLCPCLFLGLFYSYLCDLFFIIIFIFMMISRIISWIQTYMLFPLFFRLCPIVLRYNVDEECQ